jgi:hypothetical protein
MFAFYRLFADALTTVTGASAARKTFDLSFVLVNAASS